jgi:medium-chain acyl-[acyl-carrier-protein] hydrolase
MLKDIENSWYYKNFLDDTITLFKLTQNKHPEIRIICFPYAGAGGFVFKELSQYLPESVEVFAIEAPGHTHTRGVPLYEVNLLTEKYVALFLELFSFEKIILLGHSLGAYIACDVASSLVNKGLKPNLILSAAQPPHLREKHIKLSSLSIDELVQTLAQLNGVPQSWISAPELLELFIDTLRADFKMYENFIFPKNITHLNTLSVNGYEDLLCRPQYAFEWDLYFKKVSIDFISGNHLFLNEIPKQFANKIVSYFNSFFNIIV